MKDKQLVIATLLLLVTPHTIPYTFALSPLARFRDIIRVPALESRLESIILHTQNGANPDGVLGNVNSDSLPIQGLPSLQSADCALGKNSDSELSTTDQMTSGRLRNRLFGHLFNL